ncbi:hypothetical protein ASwh1_377 [Aeromonas phage Aswh_1]|nr:hypothetical protein ASwh1_377 [Aeromonas phage Aswh_1]
MKKIMEALGYTYFNTREEFVSTIGVWEESYTYYEPEEFPCWMKKVDGLDTPYNMKTILIFDRIDPMSLADMDKE